MNGKRIALMGLALAVAGAIAGLYLATRSSSDQEHSVATAAPRSEPGATRVTPPTINDRPEVEVAEADEAGEDKPKHRTYVDDNGRMVRDHRKGDPEPLVDTRTEPRAVPGKVATETILAVRVALRPLVRECAEGIDTESLADDSLLQSEVLVNIADGRLTVSDVKVRLRNADDDELIACVREAASTIDIPAEGHDDVDAYWLTHPFRLRR